MQSGRLVYAEAGGGSKGYPHVRLHREIVGAVVEIDHKDHDGTNNRRSNLRAGSHSQNIGVISAPPVA
jgi:hypothetical protein